MPDKIAAEKGDAVRDGKRLTVLLCCNVSGEKLKPKPRAISGVNVSRLPVT